MPVGTGSIKRATSKAKADKPVAEEVKAAPAVEPVKTEETAAPKKPAAKKPAAKKAGPKKPAAEEKEAPAKVKSAVLTGANPDIKFYHISDDLPDYLL